jgi:hypothetical protein
MTQFKNEYFSSSKYGDSQNVSFELEISSILRSLKSLSKITK